jgi:hypothetical protein
LTGLGDRTTLRSRRRKPDAGTEREDAFQPIDHAVHEVATTAAGLSPLEAILTNEGEGQA